MLLEIAATLDRYDDAVRRHPQSTGTPSIEDPRLDLIYRAVEMLSRRNATQYRTEQLLELFSANVREPGRV